MTSPEDTLPADIVAALRQQAPVHPPASLEHRLMASVAARHRRPSRRRRWAMPLSAAAVLALAAVGLGLRAPSPALDSPAMASPEINALADSAGTRGIDAASPAEALRALDRALLSARGAAADGEDVAALETRLWRTRETLQQRRVADANSATAAPIDPIAI